MTLNNYDRGKISGIETNKFKISNGVGSCDHCKLMTKISGLLTKNCSVLVLWLVWILFIAGSQHSFLVSVILCLIAGKKAL